MKILKRFFIFLGTIFLILFLLSITLFFIIKNLRTKEIVENEIERTLGVNITINKLEFSPLLAHIVASGITVHNPSGFVEDELAYINSVHLVFDPIEILTRKKPNIYLFALDLERLNIIKNKEGKVNIKEIIPIQEENASKEAETPFYFDIVVLSIGEVRFKDYAKGGNKEQKYIIGLKDATFVGLKDENEVIKMVVYKALENTDIGKFINLTISPFISGIGNTMGAAWGTAKSGAKGIWQIATLPFNLLVGK